jgi:hypothetical protein
MRFIYVTITLLFFCFISIAQEKPETIVQKQLDAYNVGNLEAFVGFYADSTKLYNLGQAQPFVSNKNELEKRYAQYFKNNPKKYASLRGRIVQGNYVIDKEFISGLSKGEDFEATAIYEVKGDKIVRVWFVR